jgi:hypothetical protein
MHGHILTISLTLVAAPVQACTDWKAVAAFDALVLEHARLAVVDERTIPQLSKIADDQCKFIQTLVDAANKTNDEALKISRQKQLINCDAAETMYQKALMDMPTDRDNALADTCGTK